MAFVEVADEAAQNSSAEINLDHVGNVDSMRKTTLYIPESIDERMRRAARRLGFSRAEITRSALEEYLDRAEREPVLPPSVGIGDNSAAPASDYKRRRARDGTATKGK